MEFSYNAYYRVNFIVPLTMAIFFFALLFSCTKSLFCQIACRKLNVGRFVPVLIGVAICIFFLFLNIKTLAQGGIYLSFEKETDAVIVHGVIERIEECDLYDNHKYGTGDGTGVGSSFGVKIIVEGNCYNAVQSGDLQSGDDVVITYLPKSLFVLKIIKNP